MVASLPYLLISENNIQFEKRTLSDMQNLFLNTFTADDKYSPLNRDNLAQPIQMMQLSQKQKTFSEFFSLVFEI